MRVEKGLMVALGYGKYFRADRITGLVPIEDGRGPGKRTKVYVEGASQPLICSRSEGAILRDMAAMPEDVVRSQEQRQLLADILDTVGEINPMLRSIIREQGNWGLDGLERRLKAVLAGE